MKLTDLQEARYAHAAPTTEEVYKQFKAIEKRFDYTWGENSRGSREDELGQPFSLSHPIGIEASKHNKYHGGSYAILELAFHWDMSPEVGLKWVRKFVKDNNIPQSSIDENIVDRQTYPTWVVIITFDPEHFNK